jgi:hypothetical protein
MKKKELFELFIMHISDPAEAKQNPVGDAGRNERKYGTF